MKDQEGREGQRRIGVPNNYQHLHQLVRFAIEKETKKRGEAVVSVSADT